MSENEFIPTKKNIKNQFSTNQIKFLQTFDDFVSHFKIKKIIQNCLKYHKLVDIVSKYVQETLNMEIEASIISLNYAIKASIPF